MPEGGKNRLSPCRNFAPPLKLIECEIYHLIPSFCLLKSFHSIPKNKGYQKPGEGDMSPPPRYDPDKKKIKTKQKMLICMKTWTKMYFYTD